MLQCNHKQCHKTLSYHNTRTSHLSSLRRPNDHHNTPTIAIAYVKPINVIIPIIQISMDNRHASARKSASCQLKRSCKNRISAPEPPSDHPIDCSTFKCPASPGTARDAQSCSSEHMLRRSASSECTNACRQKRKRNKPTRVRKPRGKAKAQTNFLSPFSSVSVSL